MPSPAEIDAAAKAYDEKPTEAMLIAARDWSQVKYGKPIGNEAAAGCWKAMFESSPAAARIRELEANNATLEARIRKLTHQDNFFVTITNP